MIEAFLMGSGVQGPLSAWQFVGSETALSRGVFGVGTGFPDGVQEGDLVIAVMSPLYEDISTSMVSAGWAHLIGGPQDYLCSARYSAELAIPMWQKSAANTLFVSTLVFRAPGWTTVQLESNRIPAAPVSYEARAGNQLLLNIGITPRTAGTWTGHMPGLASAARVQRPLAPAMQIYSANIDNPGSISGIYADSSSGTERNLILSAF